MREKDSCKVTSDWGDFPENTTNDNNKTKSRMIFYWQVIFLVLYLAWVSAALLLQQIKKRGRSALPWVLITVLVLVAEVVSACLVTTDLGQDGPGLLPGDFSCPGMKVDTKDEADKRKDWVAVVLILLFTRCGIFFFIHLWSLYVVIGYLSSKAEKTSSTQECRSQ